MLIDIIIQMMQGYYAWFKMSIYNSSYIWRGIGIEWHNFISYARGHLIVLGGELGNGTTSKMSLMVA